jgi:predicted DNA-binding protein
MKSEVYSWRLTPEMKTRLESEARRSGKSLAEVLEQISTNWLDECAGTYDHETDLRLRKRVMSTVGTIRGGDQHRASRSKELVREIIRRKHEKERGASRRTD